MTYNRNPLYQAVHYALGVGAVASVAFATSALAQEQEQEPAELERQLVTGSRLSQVDIEGASPVTVIDRADIERIGLNDLGDIIRQLPSITGSPLSTRTNNGGNGATLVDLRGMGAARTLVLINGKRDITDGDFSLIPLAVVERIEVLTEGAAAIYGADAVAGVVNVITRRDFQGAQLVAQYGTSFELKPNPAVEDVGNPAFRGTDGDTKRVSFVMGDTSEKGSFVIGAEYNEQDQVFQGNIASDQFRKVIRIPTSRASDFAIDGFPGCLQTGSCNNTGGSSSNLSGSFFVPSLNPSNLIVLTDPATGAFRPFNSATDAYNFAPVNFIQTPFEHRNAFVQGDYDLFENVEAYMEIRYSNRKSQQELAPVPLFIGIFDPGAPLADGGNGIPATNVFNPFGVDITDVRRRVAEDRRSFFQEVNQIQINTGLRGDFGDFAPTWTWDVSWNWGRATEDDIDEGQFVGARLAQALGPSFIDPATGVATCGTPSAPIPGCVPLNLFGGVGTITREQLDFSTATLSDVLTQQLQVGNITVEGDLFDLPAGPLALALGYEFRQEDLRSIPDSGKATDSVTGNTFGPTEGQFDVNSVFAEINVPLLSGVPGAELLEFGVGFRYDDFSTIGSTGNFMFTARYQPINGVLIRGSYSEVFREPTIGNLFAPEGDSFPAFQDPCSNGSISGGGDSFNDTLNDEQRARCIATGVPAGGFFQTNAQPRSRIGGNPNVRPENGETWTVGLAFAPEFIPGFSATVDYWEIDLKDAITSVAAESIVDLCIFGGLQEFCDKITRQRTGNVGEIDNVVASITNIGREQAQGIDFAFNYNTNTAIGLFDTRLLVTYLDSRKSTVIRIPELGLDDTVEAAGRFEDRNGLPEAVYPEWKALWTLDWSYEDFGASVNVEWLDSVTETFSNLNIDRKVESETYVDLIGRWTVPWGTTVSFGITNLFNNAPPFIVGGFNANTDTDTYRLLGRSWFVNLTHNF